MLNGHWLIAIFGKNMTLSGDSCKSIICYINFISIIFSPEINQDRGTQGRAILCQVRIILATICVLLA